MREILGLSGGGHGASKSRIFPVNEIPVGAKLARDDGMSVDIDAGSAGLIASKLCSYRE
jgi:hypothetical protein